MGLEAQLDEIKKQFGKGAIKRMSDAPMKVDVISTGSLSLDLALGIMGIPRGRVTEVYGPESCLSGDTFIQYEIRTPDGKRQNHKGGTISTLWHRFHGVEWNGSGAYQRPATVGSHFFAPSINGEGRVFQNRILDVVDTGIQECFKVVTRDGHVIVATGSHEFYTGSGYVRLDDLSPGDAVHVHTNVPFTNGEAARDREYKGRLEFLAPDQHVHHLNEDVKDDSIGNLQVISASEHGRLHALEWHNNLRYVSVPDCIESITPHGEHHVYDLKMQGPNHNYVANKFVVHNCGKSTLALHVVAEAQKLGGICAYIDTEHALDPSYAASIGVNIDDLLISQPSTAEEALQIIDLLVQSNEVMLIVCDSVAAMTPRSELEGEMGDSNIGVHARLMSQAMRKLTHSVSKSNTALVFINQLRDKVGVIYGSPEVTTGGKALKYYSSVRLDMRRIGSPVKDGTEAVANRTKVKVAKNKLAPPFKTAEFDIAFGIGIDNAKDVIEAAVTEGLVVKEKNTYFFNGDKVGVGMPATIETLRSDENLFTLVKDTLTAHLLAKG